MMVIYDCSLKEAHQYKIALRQPAMWVLYLYIHMSLCVCGCVYVCVYVCVYASVYVCVRERERDNICVRRWLSGARMRLSPQALQQNGV